MRRSLAASFARLGLPRVTLLQLHNGITRAPRRDRRLADAGRRPRRRREALQRVRADGLVRFVGLTGTGHAEALGEVIDSGAFDTVQIPHHLLAPADAGRAGRCQAQGDGRFRHPRVRRRGLLGQPPSPHAKTPYFPLALYEEERRRADGAAALGPECR